MGIGRSSRHTKGCLVKHSRYESNPRPNSQYRPTEKASPYWIKIKNPKYSQAEGREELFEHVQV